jgi:SNF2 family DNA or RNA helicase
MEIVEGRALRVRVRSPDRFTAVIPKSHYEGEVAPGVHEMLFHWGYDESLVLKNMGVKGVPSPINKAYNWPGLFKPMDHQRDTASFLSMHKRAFCFDEQGLGKTAAAAWAADYLMTIGQVKRVLVICPVSIMQAAWQQDLFKVLMHRTVGIAHGTKQKRVDVINSDCEFCIINYDGVLIVEDELLAGGFDLIIMDEATYVKNAQAKRSKSIKRLCGPDTRVWLMTGTPAAQSPEDAYGLAKLVSPDRVPKFFGSWRDMVMQQLTAFKWIPRAKAKDIVHNALQPAIRHTKEECLDLPDMMYIDRMIPLTAQQEKYYKTLKTQMLALAAGEEITAVNAAAMLNKLLQLSTGAVYADGEHQGKKTVVEFDVKPRLDALADIIDESSHKVIVFAPFTHTIEMLEKDLTKRGYTHATINGSVSQGKRGEIFSAFQYQPDPKVIIIQPQAAAHGVTLTAANTVVWFGPTTSMETYLQANARAHRNGQKNKVTVYHMQGSPAEAQLYKALQVRGAAQVSLMDLYKEVMEL